MYYFTKLSLAAGLGMFTACTIFGQNAGASELRVENFVGVIKVVTAPGQALEIISQEKAEALTLSETDGNLKVDGGIKKPNGKKCKKVNIFWGIKHDKKDDAKSGFYGGYKGLGKLPELIIKGPDDLTVTIKNTIIFAHIGDIGAANIHVGHCGKLSLGNIRGAAEMKISGSADISAKNARSLHAQISGAGGLDMEDIAKNVLLSVSSSGDVNINSAKTADINLSGSGDIKIGTITQDLNLSSSGSGDLDIDQITGRAAIDVSGSSDVTLGKGNLAYLKIGASGASDVHFDGIAQEASLTASGASDITIANVTGKVRMQKSGSSDIRIGD